MPAGFALVQTEKIGTSMKKSGNMPEER